MPAVMQLCNAPMSLGKVYAFRALQIFRIWEPLNAGPMQQRQLHRRKPSYNLRLQRNQKQEVRLQIKPASQMLFELWYILIMFASWHVKFVSPKACINLRCLSKSPFSCVNICIQLFLFSKYDRAQSFSFLLIYNNSRHQVYQKQLECRGRGQTCLSREICLLNVYP